MSAKIDPAVLARLKSGQESLNVEIRFSQPPPPGQVEAMGLKRERNLAWGVLNSGRIEALARVPQVISIRLSDRPAEPRPAVPRESRIGPQLQFALQHKERQVFDIVVSFRRPQKSPPIEGLSVDLDMGSGRLTREAIAKLADNDEVLRIELVPEMHLAQG
jgi:hypothetical protein